MKKIYFLLSFFLLSLSSMAQHFQWANGLDMTYTNQQYRMVSDKNKNIIIHTVIDRPVDVQIGPGVFMVDTTNNNSIDYCLVKYQNDTVLYAYDCPFIISNVDFDSSNNLIAFCYGSGIIDVDLSVSGSSLLNLGVGKFFFLKLSPNGTFISAKKTFLNNYNIKGLIKVDRLGNIILGGSFLNTINCTTDSTSPAILNATGGSGDYDNYIAKYDVNYNLIWKVKIGESEKESLIHEDYLALDTNNNIVQCGYYRNTIDFDPSATSQFNMTAINSATPSNQEVYILKLDPNGNFIFAKAIQTLYLPPEIFCMKVDKKNNILLTGTNTTLFTDFDPNAGVNNISNGLFISKLDENGNFVFANGYNNYQFIAASTTTGWINSLVFDDSNNYYMRGLLQGNIDFDCTNNTDFLFPNASLTSIFIKIGEDGHAIWGRGLVSLNDAIGSIAIGSNNNIYYFGQYTNGGADFDPSAAVYNLPILNIGVGNLFMAKYDNSCPYIPPPNLVIDTICSTDTAILLITTPPLGNYYWWLSNSAAGPVLGANLPSTMANPFIVTIPHNGDFITVMDSMPNGCYSSRVFPQIVIDVVPIPTINAANNQLYILSNNYTTRQWYFNGSLISSNTDTINITLSGVYSIVVTNSSGCSETASYTVISASINDLSKQDYKIYDNIESIRVVLFSSNEMHYKLMSTSGTAILSGISAQHEIMIPKHNLASGLYYLKVQEKEKEFTIKVLARQ